MANVDVWVSNQITLRFGWWQDSQSIANNSSVVGWHLQLITSGGSISSSASKSWSVTVNGKNYSGTNTVGISNGATKTLASGSTTIAHNADGTKTFSFSFSQQFDISYSGVGWIGTKSGSGSGTLTTIPRTSSVSSTSANIGENITISISRASSSFTHTLSYSFCKLSGTIATKTSSTSVSWTLPTTFYAQIPNSKSSWGTITCDTYSGSTKIGSSSCRFNVYAKESSNKPGISATVVDANDTTKALTGDKNKLIRYYSKAKFELTASPKNSATITTRSVFYNGTTYKGGSGNSWIANFSEVVSGSYKFSVTDSRGFTNSKTINKTLIEYVKLTCYMSVTNPTATGECTININGNYFNGSFGATNNTLSVQYKIDEGEWTDATVTLSGNTYKATANMTGMDYTRAYSFYARAIDKLETVETPVKYVKAKPIFDWGENDFHFHVGVVSNESFRIGSDRYLYGTNMDGNPTTIARINPTNNALELGASNLQTLIKSGENPTWYSSTYSGTYDIWTSKDCSMSSNSNCQTWRFPNGMQVSIMRVYGTWNITTAWGSVYSSPWISGQSFNIAFSEAPKVIINAYNDNSSSVMVVQCSAPTTTATGAIYLWKPVAQTGTKTWIEYIAIGRWK